MKESSKNQRKDNEIVAFDCIKFLIVADSVDIVDTIENVC